MGIPRLYFTMKINIINISNIHKTEITSDIRRNKLLFTLKEVFLTRIQNLLKILMNLTTKNFPHDQKKHFIFCF